MLKLLRNQHAINHSRRRYVAFTRAGSLAQISLLDRVNTAIPRDLH